MSQLGTAESRGNYNNSKLVAGFVIAYFRYDQKVSNISVKYFVAAVQKNVKEKNNNSLPNNLFSGKKVFFFFPAFQG